MDELCAKRFERDLRQKEIVLFNSATLLYAFVFLVWSDELLASVGKITFMHYSKISCRTWQEVLLLVAFCFVPEILAWLIEQSSNKISRAMLAFAELLRVVTGAPAMATVGVSFPIVVLCAESVGGMKTLLVIVLGIAMLLYAFVAILRHLWSVGTALQWKR